MIKTFSEYMNAKGKVVKEPPVEKVPEYKGTIPVKPEQGKGSVPYTAPGKEASNKYKVKPDKGGFADKGKSNLEYHPDTKVPAHVGEGGKKLPSYPNVGNATRPKKSKLRTEQFIDTTKDMSAEDFWKYMAGVTKAGSGEAHPSQYVKYTASLIKENANVATALIMEVKRLGLLDLLMFELLQHQESVTTLTDMMNDPEIGPGLRRRIRKHITEEVAPPTFDDGATGGNSTDQIDTNPPDMGDDAPRPGSGGDPVNPNDPPVDNNADEAPPGAGDENGFNPDVEPKEEPHPDGVEFTSGEEEEPDYHSTRHDIDSHDDELNTNLHTKLTRVEHRYLPRKPIVESRTARR